MSERREHCRYGPFVYGDVRMASLTAKAAGRMVWFLQDVIGLRRPKAVFGLKSRVCNRKALVTVKKASTLAID